MCPPHRFQKIRAKLRLRLGKEALGFDRSKIPDRDVRRKLKIISSLRHYILPVRFFLLKIVK